MYSAPELQPRKDHMTFDRFWIIYEQRHGPQPLDTKDLAFAVWTAAQEAVKPSEKDEDAEAADRLDAKDEGHDEGYRDALDDIETWAKADAESDPVTAESLIEHLTYMRGTL